ncbi:hypothetical protein B0A50_07351 [Salinomyces thailandicus]|uniref:NAD(P)-binding protein n=1 Tax=Salinomyces thailandicus TaxID=706561 RepID=A0A4U0TMW0_9PEZI|nr:hypothetical protein B0A50_07351 [Salinomyces thailandica]
MERKTVLITGCNPGGIGHALALEFHSHNLRVFATARNPSALTSLASKGIETLPLELSDPSSITALRNAVAARTGGRLDFLVNNAGRNYTVPALDVELKEIQTTFEANLFGVMLMCQAFGPLLVEAKGAIVQIGSLAGVMPYVYGSVYNASKAALHAYSATLRVELAPLGVRVLTIVTGGVQSQIARTHRSLPEDSFYAVVKEEYERRQTHSQQVGMPNEVYARSVVRQVLTGGKSDVWEGALSWVAWFVVSFLPRGVMDWYMTREFKLWKLRGTATKKVQ